MALKSSTKLYKNISLLLFEAPCIDKHPDKCPGWAANGQCKKNREYMEENCWRSCSQCKDVVLVLFSCMFKRTIAWCYGGKNGWPGLGFLERMRVKRGKRG